MVKFKCRLIDCVRRTGLVINLARTYGSTVVQGPWYVPCSLSILSCIVYLFIISDWLRLWCWCEVECRCLWSEDVHKDYQRSPSDHSQTHRHQLLGYHIQININIYRISVHFIFLSLQIFLYPLNSWDLFPWPLRSIYKQNCLLNIPLCGLEWLQLWKRKF